MKTWVWHIPPVLAKFNLLVACKISFALQQDKFLTRHCQRIFLIIRIMTGAHYSTSKMPPSHYSTGPLFCFTHSFNFCGHLSSDMAYSAKRSVSVSVFAFPYSSGFFKQRSTMGKYHKYNKTIQVERKSLS